jgi:hypothetical protein
MSEPKSNPDDKANPDGKARAAALRAEIDKLSERSKAGKAPSKPTNPRDAIHQWMADHDKKPEK